MLWGVCIKGAHATVCVCGGGSGLQTEENVCVLVTYCRHH